LSSRGLWFAGLILFWFALSGTVDAQHVLMGAAVSWLALRMRESILPRERRTPAAPWRLPAIGRRLRQTAAYLAFLLVQIVKANVEVALIALHPRLPISPAFLRYGPALKSDWGRVLMGNSITLTPGTLTVELENGEYLIHTLTIGAARTLPGWPAERRIGELESLAGEGRGGV